MSAPEPGGVGLRPATEEEIAFARETCGCDYIAIDDDAKVSEVLDDDDGDEIVVDKWIQCWVRFME